MSFRIGVLLLFCLILQLGFSQIPNFISYQGQLKATDSQAFADGNYAMQVAIYDTPSGRTPLWIEDSFDEAQFSMLQNGNVGLGVLDPSEKLEVNGNILASGGTTEFSDRRFKIDFKLINSSLEKLSNIKGYSYYWNIEKHSNKQFTKEKQIGLIAQEVEAVFPEMLSMDKDVYQSVNYGHMVPMVPVLIESIKDQHKQIKSIKKKTNYFKLNYSKWR